MTKKTIHVTIDIDGSIKIESKGFSGASCTAATAFLEKELGTVTKDVKTLDYHKKPDAKVQQQAGQ